ncbi:hypothetical protein [Micromonospora sp. RTGN7]|uniref:hypothetical protein n=1 Tax=Micromonospora sp. RTGN7 TaxID=3016526 RepID=UPI0029FED6D8|nr:hypothetical protein [Micromonospora sp. RTGN7]
MALMATWQRWWGVAAVVLAVAGCGRVDSGDRPVTPDNSAEICVDVRVIDERYVSGGTPEGRAYYDAVEAAYIGAPGAADLAELRRRYFEAWSAQLRPLVERVSDERLRTVLSHYIDLLRQRALGGADKTGKDLISVRKELNEVCPAG